MVKKICNVIYFSIPLYFSRDIFIWIAFFFLIDV